LATVGSTAPFVGLFGTVWGSTMRSRRSASPGRHRSTRWPGGGRSADHDALGLAVRGPAVLGYNWLVRRNKVAMELVRHFGGGVHMTLLGPGRAQGKLTMSMNLGNVEGDEESSPTSTPRRSST